MPQARNKLGRFIRTDEGNYIILPSLGTLLRFGLVFILIYPWIDIVSDIKLKFYYLFKFLYGLIPTPDGAPAPTKTPKGPDTGLNTG